MHSLAALLGLTACVYVILPPAAPAFAAAYLSHIGVDLLNRRGEQLLWPLQRRFALGLCRSDGAVNALLCAASTLAAALLIIFRAWHLING